MSNGDLAAALTSEAAYVQLVQRVLAGGEPGAQQTDEVGVRRHGRALVGGGRGLEGPQAVWILRDPHCKEALRRTFAVFRPRPPTPPPALVCAGAEAPAGRGRGAGAAQPVAGG